MKKIKSIIKKISGEGVLGTYQILHDKISRPIKRKTVPSKIKKIGAALSDADLFQKLNLNGIIKGNRITNAIGEGIHEHFVNRAFPAFYIDGKTRELYVKKILSTYGKESDAAIVHADKVLAGDFKWITPNAPDFSGGIDWHSNFSGASWPVDFYNTIDYSSDKRLGDVREVWEFNRHQYFVTLGKAYWLTGEDKYADEFFSEMRDWIKKNPFGYGINWLHSQETAIRGVSWIWAFYFFGEKFSQHDMLEFLKQIYLHAEFTYDLLSDHRITHNHLISEVCGLAIMGIMFPEFKEAKKWRETGLKIFRREILKQVWPDGVHGELSTNYHLFVLDSFVLLYSLIKKNNMPADAAIEKRIEMMIEYVMYMSKPDRTFPLIGDVDSGRAYKLTEYEAWDVIHNLSTGAALFNRGDFKNISGKFHESSFWLLGEEGLRKYENLKSTPADKTSRLYEDSGFAFMRNNWNKDSNYAAFRIGPSKLIKNVAIGHNHADLLSFELYANGKTLLFDPGIYLYSSNDEYRTYFRKTSAHNTVEVNGIDQINVSKVRFGLPELPLSKINSFISNNDYVFCDASTSAYEKHGISHRRKLLYVISGYMIIVDDITGENAETASQYFHLDKQAIRESGKNSYSVSSEDGSSFSICQLGGKNITAEIIKGNDISIEGWASYKYGEKHKAAALKFSQSGKSPISFVTLIYFKQEEPVNINFNETADEKKIEISVGNIADKVIIKNKEFLFNRIKR